MEEDLNRMVLLRQFRQFLQVQEELFLPKRYERKSRVIWFFFPEELP
jgi:hypothetical protein